MTASDTPETVQPDAVQRTPLPDFADIMFLLVMFLLIAVLPNFLLTDGSTGWHLYTGQYILDHHQIPQTDLFSYTFPGKPWVPYEWLADIVGALLLRAGGIKLVAVATASALATLFAMLYHACRKEGCHFLLVMLLTGLGALTSTVHWLARPHIFTFFGVLICARVLEGFRRGQCSLRRLLTTLSLTMLVWANAHPAFLIGFGLLGIYIVCTGIEAVVSGDSEARAGANKVGQGLALGFGCAAATSLINPNGFRLYTYILDYLHRTSVLSQTNEYMPPNFKQLHAICMALLFFAFVVGLVISRRRLALAPLMAVLAFAWLGLNSMRNEPLFVLVATPVIAYLLADMNLGQLFGKQEFNVARWVEPVFAFFKRIGETVDSMETSCDMHIAPVLCVVVLVVACLHGGSLFGMELVTSDFDPATKPTDTLQAMMQLPEASGFNLDNWGGYIAFKTGRHVYIDDRLDFYGEKFYNDYGLILNQAGNWKELLDRRRINWVLMPKNSSLVMALKASPDWKVEAQDKAAALLVRRQPIN